MERIRLTGPSLHNENEISRREWLITNGIGGFAGSSLVGANTRGYHGVLIAALRPPLERMLLVSKLDEKVRILDGAAQGQEVQLSTNVYQHEVAPKGYQYQVSFHYSFHPTFTFELDGRLIEKRSYMIYGENTTVVEYHYVDGEGSIELELTPFLNYRDYHSITGANDWPWDLERQGNQYKFCAYPKATPIYITAPGNWTNRRYWHQNLYYPIEAYRGLKSTEDHFVPGYWIVQLKPGQKIGLVFSTEDRYQGEIDFVGLYQGEVERINDLYQRAEAIDSVTRRLVMAADQFLVQRESSGTATVIAGYPWFTDWGRDSMIALPGLALATGRYQEGKEILETFAKYVRHGLIPNRFPDEGEEPEYNTVDASLWFFVGFYEYYRQTGDLEFIRKHLPLLQEMIRHHMEGTLWGIKMDEDSLLNQGEEGVQLTWMDAKVGNWVVTPRQGKAVEINALWYNVVRIAAEFTRLVGEETQMAEYNQLAEQILAHFRREFWNEEGGYLYDRITEGVKDPAIRPNQLFALSLPFPLLERDQGKELLQVVKAHLVTPHGLRSLSPEDGEYQGHYGGDQYHRDAAYHQGTVWGWLIGPYLGSLLYVEGEEEEIGGRVLKLMEPLLAHLESEGAIGQISEVFDGDRPYHHRGCYAQAWSIAELLRIKERI